MVFICITAFVVMGLFIGAITMAMTESMDQMKEEKAAADEERMKEFFAQNEVGKKAAEAKEADGGALVEQALSLELRVTAPDADGGARTYVIEKIWPIVDLGHAERRQ